MAAVDVPLFDEAPYAREWSVGDCVNVRFSWGDERAHVVEVHRRRHPTVTVELADGDLVEVNISRVSHA